ncbi:MAG: hypothetical protein KAT68_10830 [Bacteroidales bacterium]|nr:hypothetical protein [Bacteroidales bacterium]
MKKKYLLIILSLIISFTINAQSKKNIKELNINSTTVWEYDYKTGKEKKYKKSKSVFDKEGNIIEKTEYDNNDKISKHRKYEYDKNNILVKEIRLNENGKIYKVIEYKYDGKLKTEKSIYDGNGKLKSKKEYIYSIDND